MSYPELPESDSEPVEVLTEDLLNRWSKIELQEWLIKHRKRKSGNKPVMIARILRCSNFGSEDSVSEDSSESDSDLCEVPPYQTVTDWQELTTETFPPVSENDIINYFIITKTCQYNFDPLKPHFYIVELGFTGVYIIFLISAQKHRCGYSLEPLRRGGSNEYPQSMF